MVELGPDENSFYVLVVLRFKFSHVTLDHIIFSARQFYEVAGPSADIPSLYTLSVVSLAGLGHALDLSP